MAIPQQPRTRLLTFNDPHSMRINRDLADEIGLNESIVLLQIEYLISISSNERDGRQWTYQSLSDLKEVYFPWWSLMTISRIIKSLEEKKLILVGNYNKLGYDRTQWFALNEDGINSLHSVAIYQNDKWMYQNDKSIYQNDGIDPNKMLNGSQQNDTTIPETTTETTQRVKRAKRATPPKEPKDTTPLPVIQAIADVCKIDRSLATEKKHIILAQIAGKIYRSGTNQGKTDDEIIAAVRYFGEWFKGHWKGKNGAAPSPDNVLDHWTEAMDARRTSQAPSPRDNIPLIRAPDTATKYDPARAKAILDERLGKRS